MYANQSSFFKCYAMIALPKLWAYQPQPIDKSTFKWLAAVFVPLLLFPLVMLVVEGAYGFLVFTLIGGGITLLGMRREFCPRCVHFSCPLNTVPEEKAKAYLRQNPSVEKIWNELDYFDDAL
jgi:nitrate reductase NapE component